MNTAINKLFTKSLPHTRFWEIIQFPITRIFIAILFLIPVTLLNRLSGTGLFHSLAEPFFSVVEFVYDLFFLILFMVLYHSYTKYIERRKASELSTWNFQKELGTGFLIGGGVVCFMVILMITTGCYQVDKINGFFYLLDPFRRHMMVAFSEELLFRLIIFKLVEEFAGSWIALMVQGLIFGFAHLGNPNATVLTLLGSVIDTTLLLGCGYMLTRRIWLVMGIHWSWNFFQTGIFGMPCSGVARTGFIQATVIGPEWFTGGAYGIEASIVSILIRLLLGIYILKRVIKRDLVALPAWKRKKHEN